MPIDSTKGNGRPSTGKMQMKRLNMATSYGSLSPGSRHTEISVESECIIAHFRVPLCLCFKASLSA